MIELGLQRDVALGLQVERCLQVFDSDLEASDALFQFPRFRDFVSCGTGERGNRRLAFRPQRRKSYRRSGKLSLPTKAEVEKTRAKNMTGRSPKGRTAHVRDGRE